MVATIFVIIFISNVCPHTQLTLNKCLLSECIHAREGVTQEGFLRPEMQGTGGHRGASGLGGPQGGMDEQEGWGVGCHSRPGKKSPLFLRSMPPLSGSLISISLRG